MTSIAFRRLEAVHRKKKYEMSVWKSQTYYRETIGLSPLINPLYKDKFSLFFNSQHCERYSPTRVLIGLELFDGLYYILHDVSVDLKGSEAFTKNSQQKSKSQCWTVNSRRVAGWDAKKKIHNPRPFQSIIYFFSNLILFYVSLSRFILHRWNCSMLPHKALPALLIFCSYLAHPATMDRTHRSWGLSLDTISQWPFSIIECCEFLQSVLQKLHFSATGNRRSISTYGLEPTKKQSGCVCRQAEWAMLVGWKFTLPFRTC